MLALMLLLGLSAGSLQRPADVVKWSATAPAVDGAGAVKVQLTATIQSGWKLYALTQPQGGPKPLAIEIADGAPFTIARKQIVAPKPKTLKDENFDLQTLYYDTQAVFTVPVSLPASISGKAEIPLEITFQACGNNICLRPFTEKISVPLTVNR
jgi:DsbC/DsbD-like thiol-disulfide interchange protein